MKREFELTDEQYERLLKASQPVPLMYLSGGRPMFGTPEENAELVWRHLGSELGFKWDTARPVSGKSDRFFQAEPTEQSA